MKRLGLVLMSVALMLGMAQCKKNVETVSEGIGNQSFTDGIIRLKVNDGGKLAVFPHTGGVYYTEGDVIHVASGGAYKGTLTFHDGYFTNFSGTAPDPGATMYFYYLGGKTPSEAVGAGTLTVNISDQTTGYPVISYGASNEAYSTTNAEYTATLNNVGALVKFDVTSSSTKAATCITGMNNKVAFTLSTNTILYNQVDNGLISLPAGSGERWAVLLPQDAVSEGILGSAYTPDGHYHGSRGAVPAIKSNDYLSNGITVSLSPTEIGVLRGQFTVNGDGTRVHFSKGNLQYLGTGDSGNETPQWRFADNQYDHMGYGSNGNVTIEGYSLYNYASGSATPTNEDKQAARDLFGWGTSGAGAYPPYLTVMDASCYPYPGLKADIAGTEYDWGMNYISNGSSARTWRTMTRAEWTYLIHTRTGNEAATVNGTSNVRWCHAEVNTDGTGVNGVIIFPDGATVSSTAATTCGNLNAGSNSYATKLTTNQWISLEALGCVFLPSAGERRDTNIPGSLDVYGNYWCSVHSIGYGDNRCAAECGWGTNGINTTTYCMRYWALSVRLVCE